MSDRWNETTAFDEGKRAVQAIVDQASQQSDTQLVTLLRFSEAARLSAGAQPKVFAEPINDTFRSQLESLLAGWEASQTDVGPADALKAIPRLPLADERADADRVSRERFPRPPVRERDRNPQAAGRPEGKGTRFADSPGALRPRSAAQSRHHIARARVGRPRGRRRNVDERHRRQLRRRAGPRRHRAAGARWRRPARPGAGRHPAARRNLAQVPRAVRRHRAPIGCPPRSPADAVERRQPPLLRLRSAGRPAGADHRWLDRWPRRPPAFAGPRPRRQHPHRLAAARRAGQVPGRRRTPQPTGGRVPARCAATWPTTSLLRLETYVRDGGGVAFFVGANTDRAFYNDRLYQERRRPVSRAAQTADAALGSRGRSHARRGSHRSIRCSKSSPAGATVFCRC